MLGAQGMDEFEGQGSLRNEEMKVKNKEFRIRNQSFYSRRFPFVRVSILGFGLLDDPSLPLGQGRTFLAQFILDPHLMPHLGPKISDFLALQGILEA
ncbi:hypothetical protein ACFX1Z_040228 [Malus domestica]